MPFHASLSPRRLAVAAVPPDLCRTKAAGSLPSARDADAPAPHRFTVRTGASASARRGASGPLPQAHMCVPLGEGVGVTVAVPVGVTVAVGVTVGVTVTVGLTVGVMVTVGVIVGVTVGVGVTFVDNIAAGGHAVRSPRSRRRTGSAA